MNCAVAEANITPPVGTWMTGFAARDHASEGVLDELVAQCAVFEDGGRWAVVIRADILGFHPDSVARVRAGVAARTEIPGDHVLLSGSHTHSGPAVADIAGMGQVDEAYLRTMENAVIGAVVSASRRARPVVLGVGRGNVSGVSFIREGDGQNALTRDPDVTVLKIAPAESEDTLAVLVNFACHPTVLVSDNYLLSADYPGRIRRFVEHTLGAKTLFLQGACGDINPFWRKVRGGLASRASGYDEIDRIGRVVGAEVLKVSELTPAASASGIASVLTTVALPTTEPERAQLEEMASTAEAFLDSEAALSAKWPELNWIRRYRDWARTMLGLLGAGAYPDHIDCPVHILRIGDALLVGVAAEVFSEIGVTVKEALGRDRTFFVGYSDGCIGYIPSSTSYDSADYGARGSAYWYDMPLQARGSDVAIVEGIKAAAGEVG